MLDLIFSVMSFHVILAIGERERYSFCNNRHSICLQPLSNSAAYVHPGIPSYPSVKSPLLLPLLLPFPFAPPHLAPLPFPPPTSPSLPLSPSPLPPPSLPLPVAPYPSPPPCCQLPLPTASFLSTSSPPLPTPLPAPSPCQPLNILFPHRPPPQASWITN